MGGNLIYSLLSGIVGSAAYSVFFFLFSTLLISVIWGSNNSGKRSNWLRKAEGLTDLPAYFGLDFRSELAAASSCIRFDGC